MPHRLLARSLPTRSFHRNRPVALLFRGARKGFTAFFMLLAFTLVSTACGFRASPTPPEFRATAVTSEAPPEDPTFGLPAARVEIIEYGNFTCRECRSFFLGGIKEQLLLEYGDDLHLIWRDLPADSDLSRQAAQAAQCAYEQIASGNTTTCCSIMISQPSKTAVLNRRVLRQPLRKVG